MKIESLIGRLYTPIDNSYEFNLSNKYSDTRYLAGTYIPYKEPEIVTIMSDPFKMVIKSRISKKYKEHVMVLVEIDNQTFLTMFYIHGLVEENKETDNENT